MFCEGAARRTLSYLKKYPDPRCGPPILLVPIAALGTGLLAMSIAIVLLLLIGLLVDFIGWNAAGSFLRASFEFFVLGVVSLVVFIVGFGFGVSGLRYHLARPLVEAQKLYEHIPDDIREFRSNHLSPREMSTEQRAYVEDLEQAIKPVVIRHAKDIGRTLPRVAMYPPHGCENGCHSIATYRSPDGSFYCFIHDPRSDWPTNLHDDTKNEPDRIPRR